MSVFSTIAILPATTLAWLLLVLSSAVLGLLFYGKLTIPFKLLTQLLLLLFFNQLIASILLSTLGTNYPFYHVIQIIEIFYFGAIFYFIFPKKRRIKNTIVIVAIILGFISIYVSVFYQGFFTFPSIGSILLSAFVVGCCFILFIKMIETPVLTPILAQPLFWFASGSLFFYSITFFVLAYFKLLINQPGYVPDWCYHLLHVANFILYGSYFIAILLSVKRNKSNYEPR